LAQASGINLAAGVTTGGAVVISPAANQAPFPGGRAALVITADAWPGGGVVLQLLSRGNKTIPIVTPTNNGVYVFDGPPGQYDLSATGAVTNLNADLVRIPY
jgi:hypothetical protein